MNSFFLREGGPLLKVDNQFRPDNAYRERRRQRMRTEVICELTDVFGGHAQQTEARVEYWPTRDLQQLLKYTEWLTTRPRIYGNNSGEARQAKNHPQIIFSCRVGTAHQNHPQIVVLSGWTLPTKTGVYSGGIAVGSAYPVFTPPPRGVRSYIYSN